jgi:hypothetical protein
MSQNLIQRARDIAADQYIRLTMKNPTNGRNAVSFAEHVQRYSDFMRSGAYDDSIEVQSALVALRSVLV